MKKNNLKQFRSHYRRPPTKNEKKYLMLLILCILAGIVCPWLIRTGSNAIARKVAIIETESTAPETNDTSGNKADTYDFSDKTAVTDDSTADSVDDTTVSADENGFVHLGDETEVETEADDSLVVKTSSVDKTGTTTDEELLVYYKYLKKNTPDLVFPSGTTGEVYRVGILGEDDCDMSIFLESLASFFYGLYGDMYIPIRVVFTEDLFVNESESDIKCRIYLQNGDLVTHGDYIICHFGITHGYTVSAQASIHE